MQIFDPIAETYDAWHDTRDGRAIFNAELKCLRSLRVCRRDRWLEVGVGTGRFASGLGVAIGIDSSMPMLRIAAKRGIMACLGRAENLPFSDCAMDGVVFALSLCFIADPGQALSESRRVLRSDGRLLLGIVTAESSWGSLYKRKKQEGHPLYALATFADLTDIVALVKDSGFTFLKGASSLFWNPDGIPESEPRVQTGISAGAGFLGLLFAKHNQQKSQATSIRPILP